MKIMEIDIGLLDFEVEELLKNLGTIEDVIVLENMLHKHIGNLCDRKKEDIKLNKQFFIS